MLINGRSMKVILYDEEDMNYFGGYLLGLTMEEESERIDATTLEDADCRFVRGIPKTTAKITCELLHEIIRLDTTTMKRIAKHNLEKENEGLLKEIKKNKKEIERIKTEYEELKNRLQIISDIGADIWENGTEYEKEDDDYGF